MEKQKKEEQDVLSAYTDHGHIRKRNPGFQGKSDYRGGGAGGGPGIWEGPASPPGLLPALGGGGTAGQRGALRGPGRTARGGQCQHPDRAGTDRPERAGPDGGPTGSWQSWTVRRTRGTWGPMPPWAYPWPPARAAAQALGLPLYAWLGGVHARDAAGAHDEHHERRQACGQCPGYPGVHDHALRRLLL